PAVIIAKKLATFLRATNDADLLQFARENVGIGVTKSKHMGVIKDLRVACMIRKNQLAKQSTTLRTQPADNPLRNLTIKQLAEATAGEPGPRLKQAIIELERRRGDEAIAALGSAAATVSDNEMKQYARKALERSLSRLGPAALKEKLKDDRSEVRAAA